MKLLDAFKAELDKCENIKRVWLTAFIIDVEFIETYVLPTVLGAEQPRTRMEYEALQLELIRQGIDFRVFCDKRYIGPDQNKRTSIPVYGISPGKAGGIWPEGGITEESLFHAKVIYIEGKNGEKGKDTVRLLGSGSANLTLSGWGRQREVFQFTRVDERELYYSVRSFFHGTGAL